MMAKVRGSKLTSKQLRDIASNSAVGKDGYMLLPFSSTIKESKMKFSVYAIPTGENVDDLETHVDIMHTDDPSKAMGKSMFNQEERTYVIRNEDNTTIFRSGY